MTLFFQGKEGGDTPSEDPQLQGCLFFIDATVNRYNDIIGGYPLGEGSGTTFLTNQIDNRSCWNIPTTYGAGGVYVDTTDPALDDILPYLVTMELIVTNYTGIELPRYFTKMADNYDVRLNGSSTKAGKSVHHTPGGGYQYTTTVSNFQIFGGDVIQEQAFAIESLGAAMTMFKNGASFGRTEMDTVINPYSNAGSKWNFMRRSDASRSMQGQLYSARLYDVSQINTGVYPTVASLVADIYNNPKYPL